MKKVIFYSMVLFIVLGLAGCGAKETVGTNDDLTPKSGDEAKLGTEIVGDEIITTYAYAVLDGIDVSGLDEVVIDAGEFTAGSRNSEYKVAFFGEVKNVKINYSDYIYEDFGIEVGSYDTLKDALLIIKSSKLESDDGFIVSFEDGRGVEGYFILGDDMVKSGDKVELKSGFTALEKTPSSYTAYDMDDIVNCVGMTTDEFENGPLMEYAQKEMRDGMDDSYYVYVVNDLMKGITMEFNTSEDDNKLNACYIFTDEAIYENLSDDEKYSLMGMDFDMSVVRAKYNMAKPDSLTDIDAYGETPDSTIQTILLYK